MKELFDLATIFFAGIGCFYVSVHIAQGLIAARDKLGWWLLAGTVQAAVLVYVFAAILSASPCQAGYSPDAQCPARVSRSP